MVSKLFYFHPLFGEMIQFDLRIFFKLGWFNHQLGTCSKNGRRCWIQPLRNPFGPLGLRPLPQTEVCAISLRGADKRARHLRCYSADGALWTGTRGGPPVSWEVSQDGKGKSCKFSNGYYLLRDCLTTFPL